MFDDNTRISYLNLGVASDNLLINYEILKTNKQILETNEKRNIEILETNKQLIKLLKEIKENGKP